MKKAKIVLTSMVVLGLVGGVFASKAKARFGGITYYTTQVAGQPGVTLLNAKTTESSTPGAIQRFYTLQPNVAANVQAFITTTNS